MAPPKTSGGPVQSRLSFPTTKGGVSAAAAKAKKPVVSAVAPATAPSSTKVQSTALKDAVATSKGSAKVQQNQRKPPVDSDEEEDDDQGYVDDESQEEIEEPVNVVIAPPPVAAPEVEEISSASEDEGMENVKGKGKPKGIKDLMNDQQFMEGYKIAKAKVGGELTKSAAKESKATTILRSFDLSYEYGPCVGMTRMERWQRASKLGLDPPEIVRLILETEKEDELTDEQVDALRQTVFYGKV